MILSDHNIKWELKHGGLEIDPFVPENIQPSSIDIRLGREYSFFSEDVDVIDPRADIGDMMVSHTLGEGNHYWLKPDDFMLVNTIEEVKLPNYLEGELRGRSSIGRLGVEVHSTAGLIDPGFEGDIVLEISNNTNKKVMLYPGMRIGQIVFNSMRSGSENPYGEKEDTKYQGQKGAVGSKINNDKDGF